MHELLRVFRREAGAYFASPVAYLFVGVFLAVTLFVFFWAEAFFARNIADTQPLFQWMPLLLIALVAVVTMRSWSEERRSGTLEVLLSAPVSPVALVGGKFLAALSLVALALVLTMPLPLTVEFLGPLDWGPVIGGYVAALFLAAAYVAIGLFVSAGTDNPIVSLLVTAVIGGGFYLVGTEWLTALAPQGLADLMRALGTGARFDEITRGVLDVRDIYYYVSLVAVFLALNVYTLERLRWGGERAGARRHRVWQGVLALVVLNFLTANLWLAPIQTVRADITADNRYALSDATRTYLQGLEEPLIIRGYLSRNTHPLLDPLVPQMRNLLTEYSVVGGDSVDVEIVNPKADSQAAQQAQERFGIEPASLRTASRYESSVVSTYFHVLVKYGDQNVVLDFRDLIETKREQGADVSVGLRDPEYEITQAIRKVAFQYRSGDVLASLEEPVNVDAYVSQPQHLPGQLKTLREELRSMLDQMKKDSGGKLSVNFQDPLTDGDLAQRLQQEHGFRPMSTALGGGDRFYFHILLERDGQTESVRLPDKLEASALREAIKSGLQRFGDGFLKTVAVYQPQPEGRGMRARMQGGDYRNLMQRLRDNAAVTETDLSSGRVPSNADLLLVLAPEGLGDKHRFAIDQFLMRGGTVVMAASPKKVNVDQRQGVQVESIDTGLGDWLSRYGISIESELVLDPQSGSLVLPKRTAGGGVRMQTVDYPYFIDVRASGLADVPMLGNLNQVTMAWSSPVETADAKSGDIEHRPLLTSSERAWTSSGDEIMPDYQRYPQRGFQAPQQRGRETLAVMAEGQFTSAFKGASSPLAQDEGSGDREQGQKDQGSRQQGQGGQGEQGGDGEQGPNVTTVIEQSPPDSRLIVFGSSTFTSDTALQVIRRTIGSDYAAPLKLVQNVADWSLGDPALLAIRGGGTYSRLLRPVDDGTQVALEVANYGFALGGLVVIFAVQRGVAARRRRRHHAALNEEGV